MEDAKLTAYEWKASLDEALLEFDPNKLRPKIYEIEVLIFKRLQELELNNCGAGERQAIQDALQAVRTLMQERLQFPDWK
jgi:hypothetical protein